MPAGQPFVVTKRDQGLVSPSQSTFSFPEEEQSVHAISSRDPMEDKVVTQEIGRGTPGDGVPTSTPTRTPQEREIAKKKSQFYTEVFAYREPGLSPRERVYKDSVVTAEVKTNVIVCWPSNCTLAVYDGD